MNAIETFSAMLRDNKNGTPRGICSVCSAHEGVIRASMKQALADGSILLVESTSNQVDQYGGYTGMKPADFVSFIHRIASDVNFPTERLLLGGDHLGPNSWQKLNESEAMEKSHVLVADYVKAGYLKIHLDARMFLADDMGVRHKPLADEVVAFRAASLCATAEKAWKSLPSGSPAPVYVIGTEVPIPGGATGHEEGVSVTPPQEARRTVAITKKAFIAAGLSDAWSRVCALVVQPGVEFGDDQVFDYNAEKARELSSALDDIPNLVFEAHSTDYQTARNLRKMVEGHFCILKVGPWLTFAYREALFALAAMEEELYARAAATESATIENTTTSRLRETLEELMLENPKYWDKYYPGTDEERRLKRKYSYSDRSRYYWPEERLQAAVQRLFANLRAKKPTPTLLSQFLPSQYDAYRRAETGLDPQELAENHVRVVLRMYSDAGRTDSEGDWVAVGAAALK